MGSQPIQFAHTKVSVEVTSTQLAAANPNRTYLLIQNDDSEEVYIKFGAAAVATEGIRLPENGGSLEVSINNQNLDTREVNAVSVSGSRNVLVTEG